MNENILLKLIADIREKTGWTQEELARQVGVTFATVNRWLNQGIQPHNIHFAKIRELHKKWVGLQPVSREDLQSFVKHADKSRVKNIREVIKSNQRLQDELLLQLTYNSSAIEGTTFTIKETYAVIFDKGKIQDKTLIEHLEVTNHAEILRDIFKGEYVGAITEGVVKRLHRDLMRGIRADAGEYAKYMRGIIGVDLSLPHPEDIPEEMRYFFDNSSKVRGSLIEHVSRLHADFEAIHPFGDGNGRVGRLMMIIELLNNDYPPVLIENDRKADYYEVLEHAQRYSYSHLIKFICEEIQVCSRIIELYS